MEFLANPDTWIALLTLIFLEIVLGIDNIIFISIAVSKLPQKLQKKATNVGMLLAMVLRILLLFGISVLVAMEKPFFHIDMPWIKVGITGQSLIMLAGGIFLLTKSVQEIHHKMEGHEISEEENNPKKNTSLSNAIIQITLINIVFSFDSILTAVGMTTGIEGALWVMIIAVIISIIIMMLFAVPVGNFVTRHPTVQMLGLSFLILIGFILISEGAHMAHLEIFQQKVGVIPKGYLYFTIAFSLGVEAINMKMRKKTVYK
jgi:predicted tellurium resistance membrane protein TerC